MSNFKGTTGEAFIIDALTDDKSKGFPSVILHGTEDGYRKSWGRTGITMNIGGTNERIMANAGLIADAFNVRQQIDCDLPELKRQRDEMLSAHADDIENIKNLLPGIPLGLQHIKNALRELIKEKEHIIKSAKQS